MEYFSDKDDLPKCNILIVDDSDIPRTALKDILESLDLNVVAEAVNGNEGFEKYKELNPELVFMDIEMPECNGIESLK